MTTIRIIKNDEKYGPIVLGMIRTTIKYYDAAIFTAWAKFKAIEPDNDACFINYLLNDYCGFYKYEKEEFMDVVL